MPIEQPPSKPDYTIFKRGSKYYAKDCKYGYIKYEDRNPTSLLDTVLDGAPEVVAIWLEPMVMTLEDDIAIPKKDIYLIGNGPYRSSWNPTTTGGTVIKLNGARITDEATEWSHRLHLINLSMLIQGTYTSNPIELPYTLLRMYNVKIKASCILPSSGILFKIGSSGPPAGTFIYDNVLFHDNRQGGDYSWMFYIYAESILLNNIVLVSDHAGITSARLFELLPTSCTSINHMTIFTSSDFDTNNYTYQMQFYAGKYLYLRNVQFFEDSDISDAHIKNITNEDLDVTIVGAHRAEAAATKIIPTFAESSGGSITKRFLGAGYQNGGIATFSGDGSTTTFTIPHGLVGTPNSYVVTPLTPDADAARTITADSTNITVTYSTAPPSGTDNIKLGWYAEI